MTSSPWGMSPPPKISDLLQKVRKALADGTYVITGHAQDRMEERDVILSEVVYILKNGYHETSKDEFDPKFMNWKYAIRGNTDSGRDLRIVVKIKDKMVVITVVDKDN